MIHREPHRVLMETLEDRTLLTTVIAENVFQGLLSRGQFSHTVAAVTISYVPSGHHNIIYGEVDIRFAKHNAVSYPFVSRLLNGQLHVDLSDTDSHLDATLGFEPAGTPARGMPVSIKGSAQLAGQFGNVSAQITSVIPL